MCQRLILLLGSQPLVPNLSHDAAIHGGSMVSSHSSRLARWRLVPYYTVLVTLATKSDCAWTTIHVCCWQHTWTGHSRRYGALSREPSRRRRIVSRYCGPQNTTVTWLFSKQSSQAQSGGPDAEKSYTSCMVSTVQYAQGHVLVTSVLKSDRNIVASWENEIQCSSYSTSGVSSCLSVVV